MNGHRVLLAGGAVRFDISLLSALCLLIGCSAGGAGPKKDAGLFDPGPVLDSGAPGDGDGDDAGEGDADGVDSGAGEDAGGADGDGGNGGGLDGGNTADSSAGGDGDGGDASITPPDPYAAFCEGGGPVIKVPDGDDANAGVCTGVIAKKVFKNALCTCDNAYFAGYLQTGSLIKDSDGIPTGWGPGGGSVGINGTYYAGAYTSVGGDLRIFGSAGIDEDYDPLVSSLVAGWVNVRGDLEIADELILPGLLTVGGDATVNNLVTTACFINGTLTQRPDGLFDPAVIGCPMPFVEQPLALEEPCPCDEDELIDVENIVKAAETQNDNANPAVADALAALETLDQGPINVVVREIELPCGRYYINRINAVGALRIKVTGRTALYVKGDVIATGLFDIDLAPGAELDLFIGGNLVLTGAAPFGNMTRPADFRVFVQGSDEFFGGDIALTGFAPIGGNIYAPRSEFTSPGYVPLNGSMFLRNFHANGYVHINYDSDVVSRDGDDDSCLPPPPPPPPPPPVEPPPPECTDKCDGACGFSNTCIGGECKKCTQNSDCCAPLICYAGTGVCGAYVQ